MSETTEIHMSEECTIKSNNDDDTNGDNLTCMSSSAASIDNPSNETDAIEGNFTTATILSESTKAKAQDKSTEKTIEAIAEMAIDDRQLQECKKDMSDTKEDISNNASEIKSRDAQLVINFPVKNVCTVCAYRNQTSYASKYCEKCFEYMCYACTKVHKLRAATKEHTIMELFEEDSHTDNYCNPCQYRDQMTTALWYCKYCKEKLCEICCTEHKKLKATTDHTVVPLQENGNDANIDCDVCSLDGNSEKAAVNCKICEENLCAHCALNHSRRRATKDHLLIALQKSESKEHCDVCHIKGEIQLASKYCYDCCENLCQACADQHKVRKATTNHVLVDAETSRLKGNEGDDDIFLCDPCEQMEKKTIASGFCEMCIEFLCPSCSDQHKKMKATSSHIVSDFRGDNYSSSQKYTCDPCSTESKTLKAQFYCHVCDEYFCMPCSKQHKSFKATREHKQTNLKEETARMLSNKCYCDVCKINGEHIKAVLLCKDCEEYYCSPCAKIHSSQKTTRQHELLTVGKYKTFTAKDIQIRPGTMGKESIKPGKPIEDDVTTKSIRIRWSRPASSTTDLIHYDIRCREECDLKWSVHSTGTDKELETISGLKCNTQYRFKVRAVYKDSEGEDSCVSDIIKTKLSLARKVKEYSLPISMSNHEDGWPIIYKVPIKEVKACRNENAKTRRCVFGENNLGVPEKTIMVIGATGAGKTTLIDGMVNYILDVSWEDDFRFSIIDLMDEEKLKRNDQTVSQTEWITCYTLNWMPECQIYYKLNIIDTPGFGDTRGIGRDQNIVEQIRELFTLSGEQGISTIDGVCFITQAPLARLTAPQRYIIDSILSIFGRDIIDNIFGLITFADGKTPPVLEALKTANVPIVKTFVFNNSALFEQNKNVASNNFSPMFWKMGKDSFESFFKYLHNVQPVSLQLTTEVLQERKQLETLVEGLRPQIDEGLSIIETLRQETIILNRHERDIQANRDFTYHVDKTCQRKVDLEPGIHVTNCLVCNRTCHENCKIANDNEKNRCSSMKNGYCTVCPQHCAWQNHKNNPYRFEFYKERVQSTYEELKARYQTAQSGATKQMQVVIQIKKEVREREIHVQSMIHEMRLSINRISAIALKPNPLSSVEYIDLLIDAEKQEAKPGYRSRIKTLQKFRKDAKLVQEVPNQDYKPFGNVEVYLDEPEKFEQTSKSLKQKFISFFK